MSGQAGIRFRLGVLAAALVVLVLAALLAARLDSWSGTARAAAPPAIIPAPKPIDVKHLTIQCWSCPGTEDGPLVFRTDLDMLAPLGTGTANAATWFAQFAKPNGPRAAEGSTAQKRTVDHPPIGKVLPPDDPLLLEAEKWCDQATMKFYPDIFPLEGPDTRLPNLLLTLILARSWVARGMEAPSFDSAMADFTRAIRLGRLLRQEDVILVNDLIGLACIRIGAEAIFERARTEGKLDLALLAAVVAAEAPPQKLLSAARLTSIELGPYLRKGAGETYRLELPDPPFQATLKMANGAPDRRFRHEAICNLHIIGGLANSKQAATARGTLDSLTHSKDTVVAALARSYGNRPVTPEEIKTIFDLMAR